jgi:hypothetical protein
MQPTAPWPCSYSYTLLWGWAGGIRLQLLLPQPGLLQQLQHVLHQQRRRVLLGPDGAAAAAAAAAEGGWVHLLLVHLRQQQQLHERQQVNEWSTVMQQQQQEYNQHPLFVYSHPATGVT